MLSGFMGSIGASIDLHSKKQCPLYEGTAFAGLLAEQGCDEPHG